MCVQKIRIRGMRLLNGSCYWCIHPFRGQAWADHPLPLWGEHALRRPVSHSPFPHCPWWPNSHNNSVSIVILVGRWCDVVIQWLITYFCPSSLFIFVIISFLQNTYLSLFPGSLGKKLWGDSQGCLLYSL